MNIKLKTLALQFVSFAVLFLFFRFLVVRFTSLSGVWIPISSALIATVLSPQFRVIKTKEGSHVLMKWIFLKGIKTFK